MFWTGLEPRRDFGPWLDLYWPLGPRGSLALEQSPAEFPALNIWVNADEAILTTEIPGVTPDSVGISVMGRAVTLKGDRQPEREKEGDIYHRRERWQGQFSKTIELPFNIESGRVEATFTRGILKVTLPRASADKPKTIKIKSE